MEHVQAQGRTGKPPVLCVVGPSKSGKTTLMEGLIQWLSKRGYRVATIKHTHHTVELDHPGKDSWRHRRAGAVLSVVCSRGIVAVFSEVIGEATIETIRDRFIEDADLILAEGYKNSQEPKIVVVDDRGWDQEKWTTVVAVASDHPVDTDLPVFRRDDLAGIVSFLKEKFLDKD